MLEVTRNAHTDFYPRSPCGERRPNRQKYINRRSFLSTLSLRRATIRHRREKPRQTNFYPRSPCGERPGSVRGISSGRAISIHALLAESDTIIQKITVLTVAFLSTLSLRRATILCVVSIQVGGFLSTLSLRRATSTPTTVLTLICISIHALLAESDGGGRLSFFGRIIFLSTLSLRRATASDSLADTSDVISIHALLAESD